MVEYCVNIEFNKLILIAVYPSSGLTSTEISVNISTCINARPLDTLYKPTIIVTLTVPKLDMTFNMNELRSVNLCLCVTRTNFIIIADGIIAINIDSVTAQNKD